MKILFVDTETGGITKRSALIQLSGIVQLGKTTAEEFNFFVKPYAGSEVTDEALRIQGRTREEVETFEPEEVVFKKFMEILDRYIDKYNKEDKFIIAGYNVRFDIDVIGRFLNRHGEKYLFSYIQSTTLDPLQWVAPLQLLKKIPVLKDNKLETWCNYFEIELKAHDSLEDIRATKALTKKMMKLMM